MKKLTTGGDINGQTPTPEDGTSRLSKGRINHNEHICYEDTFVFAYISVLS